MNRFFIARIVLIIILAVIFTGYFTYLMSLIIERGWLSDWVLMAVNVVLVMISIAIGLLLNFLIRVWSPEMQSTKQLTALLQHRESHLKAILDGTYDGIVTIDEHGTIEDFNQGAVKIFGYQPDEVVGQKIELLLPDNERADHRKAISHANLKGAKVIRRSRDLYGLRKDGSLVPVEVTLNKVINDNHVNYVGVVRDVSALAIERNNLVAALIEAESANEAKNRLLSAASHELRTPLNAILGFSELLIAEQQKLPVLQLNQLKDIHHSAELLLLLVNDVLDYAKLESKQLHLNVEVIELANLIKESLKMSQHDFQRMHITYHLECAADIYISVDYYRFQQVLLNLISNACKYNRYGGRVDIIVRLDDNLSCALDIIDSGIGVKDDRVNDLFVPFSRLHDLRNSIEGTGIGLAICKHLIEAMDGAIEYKKNPRGGSIFTLSMPLSEKVITPGSMLSDIDELPQLAIKQEGKIRVLYVEDNAVNIRLMEAVLKRLNVSMTAVLSAEDAFEYLQVQRVDIIFMDINLPGMSGVEAAAKIATMPDLSDIPVIAVSASLTEVKTVKGCEYFYDTIAKPFKMERIRRVIVQAMTELVV